LVEKASEDDAETTGGTVKLNVPIGREDTGKLGDEEVRGLRVGPLLVHPDVRDLACYTVTHIQSGRAVRQGICCKVSAIALAKALKHLDWNVTVDSGEMTARIPAALKAKAQEILRKWESSVHQCVEVKNAG
jgi:hypothetical protein